MFGKQEKKISELVTKKIECMMFFKKKVGKQATK